MCNDEHPVAQRIHRENAERMLLASFVAGLSEDGKQVKFHNPQDLRQALTALAVREALKQEKFADTFYTKFDKSVRLSNWQDREPAERHSPRHATDHLRTRRYERGTGQVALETFRLEQNLGAMSAKGVGTARECPTRLKCGKHGTPPERKIRVNVQTVHARPVTIPSRKRKGNIQDTRIQGNE